MASSLLAVAAFASPIAPAAAVPSPCQVGAYRGPGRNFVTITERPNTAETGEWRYHFRDGRLGSTKDGAVRCAGDAVLVTEAGKPAARWPRIALRTTPTTFQSDGVALAGLLIEPPVGGSKPPLVVCVHGSENVGSIRRTNYPYMFAAQGIAAFVYDKRGTGMSQGAYTQNFHRLARDVIAASAEAKRLAKRRYARFGLFGASQGGWVAPAAANAAGAQFVAIGFGLLLNPLEEDSEQVQVELRKLGYGADVLAKARNVTDATGAVMAAHFEKGYDRLASVRKIYGAEPWFDKMKGEFTGDILAADEAALRREGRAKYDDLDIDWKYDAMGALRAVTARQLWVIAGSDREAPPAITIERLLRLRRDGRPIRIAVFPGTGHGIYEFIEAADGTRTNTRITEGYYRLLADWIHRRHEPPYGAARFPRAE